MRLHFNCEFPHTWGKHWIASVLFLGAVEYVITSYDVYYVNYQ